MALSKNVPSAADAYEKDLFVLWTQRIITWTSASLVILFAWLQIRDLQADAILTPVAADILWRGALIIYYACWVAGTRYDTRMQALVYVSLPGKGKWPKQAFVAFGLFVVIAVALLWARGHIEWFAVALTIFVAVDHGIWYFYIRKFLRDTHSRSRLHYAHSRQYYQLEMLNSVRDLVFGSWKFRRLAAGIVIVVVLDVLAFSASVREGVAVLIRAAAPWLTSTDAVAVAYTLLVAAFVGVMEGWHWAMRISTGIRLKVLAGLSKRYELEPR